MLRPLAPAARAAPVCRPRPTPLRPSLAARAARPGRVQLPLPRPSFAPAPAPARASPRLPPRPAAGGDAAAAAAPAPEPAKKPSKPRLPGLDSLRFFLIAYIGVGHFVSFATRDAFLLKLFTQVNVWVGAFFVLSGYVAAYTATEIGKFEAGPRVKPAGAYAIARIAGFYPLFLLVNVLFGAMFVFADAAYNGPIAAAFHGLLSATLAQAWFPAHAEIWNAPTWFLSALAFAMVVLPHTLPWIASLRKDGLKKLLLALTAASLLGKLAYSYDLGVWTIMEGVTSAKAHPNILLWNVTRFHPFYNLLEVLMGAAAARMVMVDGADNGDGKAGEEKKAPGSALLPALGLLGITAARAAGWLQLNDPLTRALLFVPLFIVLVMRLHRNTLAGAKGLTALLGTKVLTYLGTISFPIFILHGAIGQVFYKKIIATKLWGGVMGPGFFPAYCAIVLAAAVAAQHLFLENKKVQEVSASITKKITAAV
ncbi:acyltransferase [Raphidocelis subcapitata]|uniref:Acyltransferase n=1 Tax=Raphidocelis subcapitata TaxID=307507 RepID=A0A2V0PDF3_9CHLO|nr:acyltransferase [Raphidocelis subcapitata]|eukprot:GBF97881.1 acyltransferase [Raphidocelis subcapitata]